MGYSRLIDISGEVGTTYLWLRRHAKVNETVTANEWCIRGNRSRQYHALYDSILAVEVPSND